MSQKLANLSELFNAKKITRRDMLKVSGAALLAGAAGSLVGCAPAAPTAQEAAPAVVSSTVKLGLMDTLTGVGSIHAPSVMNCVTMAVSEINAAGGVLGQQIDLIVEDNHTDVDISIQKATKLVKEDKVAAMIDMSFSNQRIAVANQVAEPLKAIYISPVFYEGGICGRYFFSTGALPNQSIDPMVPWAMNEFGPGFYLIGSDYAWGRGSAAAAKAAIEKSGAKLAGEEYAPLGTSEWSAIIQRMDAAEPSFGFLWIAGNDLVTFLKQFIDFGLKDKVRLGFTYMSEEVTPSLPPENRTGLLATTSYLMSLDTPQNKAFLERFRKSYGQDQVVTVFGEGAYDSVYLWKLACEKAGTFETEAVVNALDGLTFPDAPQGAIKIDPATHHSALRGLVGESTEDPTVFNILTDFGMVEPVWPDCKLKST
jgi:urea transport system substrate-binding protein